jgi:hypothetical protein
LNWWLPETAVRLFPDSPNAKEHSTEAPKSKPPKPDKNYSARGGGGNLLPPRRAALLTVATQASGVAAT